MPAGNPLAYFTPEQRTQFFPRDAEEEALVHSQPYLYARNTSGTSHERALEIARQAMSNSRPEWDMTDEEFDRLMPARSDPMAAERARWEQVVGGGAGGGGGGGGGGQQQQGRVTPQALARARAMQEENVRRQNKFTRQAPGDRPADLFGMGGGDWAGAWERMNTPRGGLFDALAGNQVNAFLNYDNQLDKNYNSMMGPYGQMQQAAAVTAPARASKYISDNESETNKYIADKKFNTQASIANRLFDAIGGVGANSPGRILTSYGASVEPEGFKPISRYRLWKDMRGGDR